MRTKREHRRNKKRTPAVLGQGFDSLLCQNVQEHGSFAECFEPVSANIITDTIAKLYGFDSMGVDHFVFPF